MEDKEKELMDRVWQYPLYKGFARRRAHRFALGAELKDAPFPFKSEKTPVPLTEFETALLCWAGHGVTGCILGDLEISVNTFQGWDGRTHPNPCNDQHQELLFINDEGVFLYRPKGATKVVEIETEEDREKILSSFREGKVQIADKRPDIPAGALLKLNVWATNKPGQTIFFPIVDITYEYINFLMLALCDDRYQILDDRAGNKPAGIGKWIDNGYLNGPPVPLSMLESMVLNVCNPTAQYMVQNINLACAAMGLAGFVWGGFLSMVILGGTPLTSGLGFRFVTGKDGMPTPVGKDGYIESLAPPYVNNMEEAVDRVLDIKFGREGIFTPEYKGEKAWKNPDLITKVSRPNEEGLEAVRAFCKYIYDTYGRFPAFYDAIQMPVAISVHHPDIDFYDKYFVPEVLSKEQREHMQVWH